MLKEIWGGYYWDGYLCWIFVLILILVLLVISTVAIKDQINNPPTEQIQILAVGKLLHIRATGSFNIYDTELKFEDGSMLCVTYSFSREHNLREGLHYKIWDSSFYGYRCKLLKEN